MLIAKTSKGHSFPEFDIDLQSGGMGGYSFLSKTVHYVWYILVINYLNQIESNLIRLKLSFNHNLID